jgi:hypothetical protein
MPQSKMSLCIACMFCIRSLRISYKVKIKSVNIGYIASQIFASHFNFNR